MYIHATIYYVTSPRIPTASNNNKELCLHDHTSTYNIAEAIIRNQNYIVGKLRYFDNNLSRTSEQVA